MLKHAPLQCVAAFTISVYVSRSFLVALLSKVLTSPHLCDTLRHLLWPCSMWLTNTRILSERNMVSRLAQKIKQHGQSLALAPPNHANKRKHPSFLVEMLVRYKNKTWLWNYWRRMLAAANIYSEGQRLSFRPLVLPILLLCSETWTMSEAFRSHLNSFGTR